MNSTYQYFDGEIGSSIFNIIAHNSPLFVKFSVCEYYAHVDCQDFVVSDCKECATYVPQKDSVSDQYFMFYFDTVKFFLTFLFYTVVLISFMTECESGV